MRIRINVAIESKTGKTTEFASSQLKIEYRAGELVISGLQYEIVSESNGGKASYKDAQVELGIEEIGQIMRLVCKERPDLIPGFQHLASARQSLEDAFLNYTEKA